MHRSLKSIRVIRLIRGPLEDELAGKQTTNDSNCTNGCRMCCVVGENRPEPPVESNNRRQDVYSRGLQRSSTS